MKVHKAVWVVALLAAMSWSTPALAGHHFGETKHGKSVKTFSDVEAGETGKTTMDVRSNKGGADRGLDRANDVAGEHGEAGRTKAFSTHGHIKIK
jgi:hypothetical protein